MDRIYFITTDGKLIGRKTARTPRKLKKWLKKRGMYSGPRLEGFPLEIFNQSDTDGNEYRWPFIESN